MLNEIHNQPNGAYPVPYIDQRIVDSKRLQMFYVSVKEGSFSAAAQLLSLSPSAISHAMKGLEEELGCALFRRFGPQVKPTGAAVRLMPMVEEMLIRMSSMKSELASLDGRLENVAIRIPGSLSGLIQSSMLATFLECFPGAHLEILLRGDAAEETLSEPVDFEISYLNHIERGHIRRDLINEKLDIYVAPFHGLGQKSKATLEEVRTCLLIFPDRSAHALGLHHLGGTGSALRTWILPSALAAGELALHGQGLAFLPEWAAGDHVRSGKLVKLQLHGLQMTRTCSASWEKTRPLTWVADVFLNLLVTEIQARMDPNGGIS